MQYGGRSGGHHTGRHRLITPSLAPRAAGEREGRPSALPDILWRASGVTTRPGSGLGLTVRHVDVPQHHSEAMPPLTAAQGKTNARLSRFEPSGRPIQYQPPCSHHQRRSSLRDALLSRQKVQPSALLLASGSSTAAHPKATRTMLPPLPLVRSPPPQPAEQEEKASSSSSQDASSSLEDSEDEVK